MDQYLDATDLIDWRSRRVLKRAHDLRSRHDEELETARACFEWVRDRVLHRFMRRWSWIVSGPSTAGSRLKPTYRIFR